MFTFATFATFARTYTGAYPWAASTDLTGAITVPVVATNAACPDPQINTAVLNQAQFPGNSVAGTSLEFNTANNSATDGVGVTTPGALNTYIVTVTNTGPAAADGATISDVPVALTYPGTLGAATVACTATNGTQCPGAAAINTASTIPYVSFNTGVIAPRLPVTGVLSFNYQCTVN